MAKKKVEPTVEAIEDWDTLEPTGETVVIWDGYSFYFTAYVNINKSGVVALVDDGGDVVAYDWDMQDDTKEYLEAIADGAFDYLGFLGSGKVKHIKQRWTFTFAKSVGWQRHGMTLVSAYPGRKRDISVSAYDLSHAHPQVADYICLRGNRAAYLTSDNDIGTVGLKPVKGYDGHYRMSVVVEWDETEGYTPEEIKRKARKALQNYL